jgi:phosphoribosylaminoimidazole (AIR) synthetase
MGSLEDKTYSDEIRSTIRSTIGGVMTKEVGAVTGELEVATRYYRAEDLEVAARYSGAEEWYTVEGRPIEPGDASHLPTSGLHEVHENVVRHLTTPGPVVEGNEQATSLLRFSPVDGNG